MSVILLISVVFQRSQNGIGARRVIRGPRVQPQIAHPGPDSLSPFFAKTATVGPSVCTASVTGLACRELSVDEIARIAEQFGEAARRAREAGYDGAELHAAHGYMLLGSFLTPWRNKRNDEYSGRSVEGRTRFVIECIRSMKDKAGEDFPLTLRISGYEQVPGGRDLQDTQRIAPLLVEAGIDAFHVSGGVSDRFVSQIVCGSDTPNGHNLAGAYAVKQVVDVPVMTVGRIHDPHLAEQILERGQADLVVMGRPLLADPDLPRKVREGRLADIRRCISCQNCIDAMARDTLNCAVNAEASREGSLALKPAAVTRRVLVVGGGPGGMEAARVAALRGHRVTLVEKLQRLGGAFTLACAVHPENEPFLDYLLHQMQKLPIRVRLGEEVTPETVERLRPDVIVVATGGEVVPPEIPGSEQAHVFTGPMLRRLLAGVPRQADLDRLPAWQRLGLKLMGPGLQRHTTPERLRWLTRLWMPLGRRIAIVGADLAAVELAEFLSQRGRQICLLERGEKIAPEVGSKRRAEHMNRLSAAGVAVNTGLECREITATGIELRTEAGACAQIGADSVILAGEVRPDTRLLDRLAGEGREVHAVGDCTGLGLVRKATEDAMRAACAI